MSHVSFEGAFRGPFIGDLAETVENSFYFGPHPLNVFSGAPIDASAADSGNTPSTDILRPGLILGKIFSSGKVKQWDPTATDGTQYLFGILDNPGQKMNVNGAGVERLRGNIMIRGFVRPDRLLIAGNSSFGISGNAWEYMLRQQLALAGFMVQEDHSATGLLGWGTSFGGAFRHIAPKTADYTVREFESGTLFTNRGASGAVNFTLPATPKRGLHYGFYGVVDQNLKVTSGTADTLVVINDATADSISFETASLKIGGMFEVFGDGTGWLTRVSAGQTSNGTTSGQLVTIVTA